MSNGDSEYQSYLDERSRLIETEVSTAAQYDKAILSLSGSALALSIAFVRFIAPNPDRTTYWMLAGAWTSFIVAIVLAMLSLQTSIFAYRRARDILDAIRDAADDEPADEANYKATATTILNCISLIVFILGVILLLMFAYSNLPEPGNANENETAKEEGGNPTKAAAPAKEVDKKEEVEPGLKDGQMNEKGTPKPSRQTNPPLKRGAVPPKPPKQPKQPPPKKT